MKLKKSDFNSWSVLLFLIYIFFCLTRLYEGVFPYLLHFTIGVFVIKSANRIRYKNVNFLFVSYLFFFLILIINGINHGNFFQFILADFSKFSLGVLLFVTLPNINLDYNDFPKLAVKWLYFGVPLVILIIAFYGIEFSNPENRDVYSNTTEVVFSPVKYIWFSVLLIPFFQLFNKKEKFMLIAANCIIFLIGLMTVSRAYILTPLLSMFFSILFLSKFKRKLKVLVLLILFIPVGFIIIRSSPTLNKSLDYFFIRLTMEDFSNGRDAEEELYLESISDAEFILGKGLGGANSTWIWQETLHGSNMMHKGYMYLILKGGVIVALLYYTLFLLSIFFYLWKKKEYSAWGIVLIMILILEISTTQWLYVHHIVFMFIALSFYIHEKTNKKVYMEVGIPTFK